MTNFNDSYQVMQSYEDFKKLVYKRGLVLLQEKEPNYCKQFMNYEVVGLEPRQTTALCNPLLSGKFNRFVDLLESLHEIGIYWKRLTETVRLLEADVPETSPYQIEQASWFLYNLDSYWHAAYGLEGRMIAFLTRFKKIYESPSSEEAYLLEEWTGIFKTLKTEGTKKIRDPMAHFRSQGIQGLRDDHLWEAILLREDASETLNIEVYDNHYLQYKEFYLGYVRTWLPQYYEALSDMFERLCIFSLERLELR